MLRSSHDACGCSTQTTSTINLKRSTLHPHEGQADRPDTPSDSVNLGSNPGPPARESASNRCVFVVSSLAGIVLKLPRVSYPATHRRQPETPNVWVRGANGRRVSRGRFRVVGCGAFRLDFDGGLGGEAEETALFLPLMRQVFAQSQQPARRQRVGRRRPSQTGKGCKRKAQPLERRRRK